MNGKKIMRLRCCIRTVLFVILIGMVQAQATDLKLEWIQLADNAAVGKVFALNGSGYRVYAGTSYGVLLSESAGLTWRSTAFEVPVTVLTVDGDTVYAGTWNDGIFRSDDVGRKWKSIHNGLRFHEGDERRFYGTVYRILVIDDTLINVMYHGGTYTSMDRGETWHDISKEWHAGNSIYSMASFDGYLWSAISIGWMARSPDNGQTWQSLGGFQCDRTNDWAVLRGQLYVAGQEGVGRWNEGMQTWEYPMDGLPVGTSEDLNDPAYVHSFAVRSEFLFAGLEAHGIYVFDTHSEVWVAVGLQEFSVLSLLSHGKYLYAGTRGNGIYRAKFSSIQPHGKVLTTWARTKQPLAARE